MFILKNQVFYIAKKWFSKVVSLNVGGKNVEFSSIWLRDMCRCSKCYQRKQRSLLKIQNNFITFDNLKPKIETINSKTWKIIWQDGHESEYTESLLSRYVMKTYNNKKLFWNADILNKNIPNNLVYDSVCQIPAGAKIIIETINKYGFCLIKDAPKDKKGLSKILNLLGGPMDTLFSDDYDSTMELTDSDIVNDLGWTKNPVPGHTDFSYYYNPSAVVGLHLLKHEGTGGMLSLVDGFYVAEKLKMNEPEVFKDMLELPIRWTYYTDTSDESEVNLIDTILKLDSITGHYKQIKWNPAYLFPIHVDNPLEMLKNYKSLNRLFNEFNKNEENMFKFQPEIGTILLFDNWRMIHSRMTGFQGYRIMHCGDISKDSVNITTKIHL